MAGAGQIPFSNPGGKNQFTGSAPLGKPMGPIIQPTPQPGVPANNNPYAYQGMPPVHPGAVSPASTTPVPVAAGGTVGSMTGTPPGTTSSSQGFITDKSSYANGQNDLEKQLIDIYGKGVGGSLFALLNGMSGTNSQIMQEFIASLKPQMAAAQANTNAALGAGGVSANSSVAAIADSNLQSQEFAAISGEQAKLTLSQEELTAQLLSGMKGDAAKEVATSGWQIFGDVVEAAVGIATGNPGLAAGGINGAAQYKGSGGGAGMTPAGLGGSNSSSSDSIASTSDPNYADNPFGNGGMDAGVIPFE